MILYNEKDRVQEWRKSLNILTNCIKTIRKAENLRNKLNDKITRLRTFEMSDFNLFLLYFTFPAKARYIKLNINI